MSLATFVQSSAHSLPQIADGSVQMIATSPPYYLLRAYAGEQGVEWPAVTFRLNEWAEPTTVAGCDPNCAHEWTDGPVVNSQAQTSLTNDGVRKRGVRPSDARTQYEVTKGAYCSRCGGWRGGLGMEPSPVAYIGHLILCLREWRRVLRDDGVCFVNLGDSYNTSPAGNKTPTGLSQTSAKRIEKLGEYNSRGKTDALKPKDLLGIPWMFALAARADGWYLRSDIIWSKPNPMPESVTDRPTKAHDTCSC